MDNTPQSPSTHISSSVARAGRYSPTCSLCGLKHWPKDPACLGKKGTKAKKKTKSKRLAKLKKESQVVAEQVVTQPVVSSVKPQPPVLGFDQPPKKVDPELNSAVESEPKTDITRPDLSESNEVKRIKKMASRVLQKAALNVKKQISAERQKRISIEEKLAIEQKMRIETENKFSLEVKKLIASHKKSQTLLKAYAAQMDILRSRISKKQASKPIKKFTNTDKKLQKTVLNITPAIVSKPKSPGDTSSFRIVPSRSASNAGLLLGLRAVDIMEKNFVTAKPEDSIVDVFDRMLAVNSNYALVFNKGRSEGVISRADLMGNLRDNLQPYADRWKRGDIDAAVSVQIKWIMSKQLHAIKPETSCSTTMKVMRKLNMCPLPVIDENGKPHGIVTPFTIFKIRALLTLESKKAITIMEGNSERVPARVCSYLQEVDSYDKIKLEKQVQF